MVFSLKKFGRVVEPDDQMLFTCMCHNDACRVSFCSSEEGCWLHVHMDQRHGFFKRLGLALKFVLKIGLPRDHYGEVGLGEDEVRELHWALGRHINRRVIADNLPLKP